MGLGTCWHASLGMSAVHFHGDFAWNLHLIGLSAVPRISSGTAALSRFSRALVGAFRRCRRRWRAS